MSERSFCGGGGSSGKGGQNAYSPQISQYAGATSSAGNNAQSFAQNYFNNTISPMVSKNNTQATTSADNMNAVAGQDAQTAGTFSNLANGQGASAINNFYDQASSYDQPAAYENAATQAKGDLGQAAANQQTATQQQEAAAGISPTSGAAIAGQNMAGVQNAASQAAAMNQARNAAKTMGLNLSEQAAGMGTSNANTALQAGQAGASASQGAAGVTNAATGMTSQAAAVPLQGYSQQEQGNAAPLSAYTSLGNTSLQTSAAGEQAVGDTIGSLGGIALNAYTGGMTQALPMTTSHGPY